MPQPRRSLQAALAVALLLLTGAVGLPHTGATPASAAAPAVSAVPVQPRTPSCLRATGPATPCAHSVQLPAGTVHGVMMIIAAGGWGSSPHLADGTDKSQVLLGQLWREAGWKSVLVEHTSGSVGSRRHLGPTGFADVVAWYDALRAQTTRLYGARVPVCAFGQSSAGNFALLLGVFRPSLSCVVTEGAPTDLNALPPGRHVSEALDAAFAPSRALRARYSPASYDGSSRRLRMPILMGHLRDDDIVSDTQLTSFGAGLPHLHRQVVVPGDGCPTVLLSSLFQPYFAHLCADDPATPATQRDVNERSWGQWRTRERAFAALIGTRG